MFSTTEDNANSTQTRRLRSFAGAVLGSLAGGAGPSVATAYNVNGLYPVSVTRNGDKTGDGIADAPDSETLAYDDQGRETRGIDGDWHSKWGQTPVNGVRHD